ncbi:MAG: peptidoglycan D,D-transpeptidase FtsI family protein [Candidatus Saccharimonadales bacterium]
MQREQNTPQSSFLSRTRLWYGLLLLIFGLFIIRLFYLQVIRHDYYSKQALAGQLKQYELPAVRGLIEAHDGNGVVPIVLNQTLYTLFADPKFIKDPQAVSKRIQAIIGGQASNYEKAMRQPTRYAILAKKLNKNQKSQLDKLGVLGLGTRDEPHRIYPQGDLAAQLLGFVDDDGAGKYGIEQYLNKTLGGTPGELKSITDAQGVPLLSDPSDVIKSPQNGKSVLLTVNLGMQKQLQDILAKDVKKANSKSGSAIIIDPNTGAVKAMANYPSYNPDKFYQVSDPSVFNNAAVSSPLEVGSIMKPLTLSAAMNIGVVNKNTTYYDPGFFKVDGATVTNVEEVSGAAERSVTDILRLSLNTGATWLLSQMGGGQINQKARDVWHDYMVNHYRFGKPTGIEQGFEAAGSIPPTKGYGLNIQYANTAFGQGMTATMTQMAAAFSSIINGGTYYQPRLVDQIIDNNNKSIVKKPVVLETNVIKTSVSNDIRSIMEYSFKQNHLIYGMPDVHTELNIGAKSGTPQIAQPGGGYYAYKFNGTFLGFVGGNKPQYVIAVRVNEPNVAGYAGSKAAAPVFVDLVNMLINNFGITPKS